CRVIQSPISINSRPGRGSTFSVQLPSAKPRSVEAVPQPRKPFQGPINGSVVLCIENEPTVLEGMATLLRGWGCEVLSASSRQGALEAIAQSKLPPDIILADYHLDEET